MQNEMRLRNRRARQEQERSEIKAGHVQENVQGITLEYSGDADFYFHIDVFLFFTL